MAHRSSAIASSSTGGNLTATPAGVAAHDYLGALYSQDTSNTATTPAGWTSRQDLSGGPDGQGAAYYDKDDASGSDAFTWTNSTGNPVALITAAWSGRDNAAPRTALAPTAMSGSLATPISASITGVTAAAGDDIAVWIVGDQVSSTARWNCSTVTGYTERQDGVAVDWVSLIALDTLDAASAGATGSLASTLTRTSGSGNAGWAAVVVAIKAGVVVDNSPKPASLGQWDPELRLQAWW